jgi:uncharacterized protein YecA (UPF0149 family)
MRRIQPSAGVYRAVVLGLCNKKAPESRAQPVPRNPRNVGRNSPCPCGSGKKFKQCHLGHDVVVRDSRKTA